MKIRAYIIALIMIINSFSGFMVFAAENSTNDTNILYFCENLDSTRGGLVKSLEFGPGYNDISIVDDENNKDNKYICLSMRCEEGTTSDSSIITRFKSLLPKGDVIISFRLMFENLGGCSSRVAVRSLEAGGNEIYPIEVTSGGQMLGMGGVEILKTVQEGKFYNVSLAFDLENGTYDAYVNGLRKVNKVRFRDGLPYSFDNLALILFNTRYATVGCKTKYCVDDIKVYKGKKPLKDEEFLSREWNLALDYNSAVSSEMIEYGMKNNIVLYVGASKALYEGKTEFIDSANPEVVPFIKNNSTLIPARFIVEALGGTISYDDKDKSALINLGGKIVEISSENDMAYVDGEEEKLPVAPTIEEGRFFVPVRFMGEITGKKVFWDKTGIIIIGDKETKLNWRENTSYLSAIAGELVYERPTGKEILGKVREFYPGRKHPRLLADEQTFEKLREEIKTNPVKAQWYSEIKEKADKYLVAEPITLPENAVDITDQGSYFSGVASNLAFVYQIEGDRKYADRLVDEIQKCWLDSDFWQPYAMLALGRALGGFAIAYDWIYDVMPEKMKTELRQAIVERIYSEVYKDYRNIFPRERSFAWTLAVMGDNWNTTINNGVITSALVMGDEEDFATHAETMLTEAMLSLEAAFNQLAPDGSWYEGPGYWTPTAATMISCMESLRKATGTDYGLFKVPGMDKAGYFIHEMSAAAGIFNFNFAEQRGYPAPQLMYFADRLGDDGLKQLCIDQYEKYKGEAGAYISPSDLILAGDIPSERVDVNLPLDAYYRGAEAISMRSGWDNKTAVYAGIHSGFNGAPNAQLDTGSFVIEGYGERFITDFGPENYGIAGNSFAAYMNRAEGANCYIINPDENYMDQEKSAYCHFDRYETNSCSALAVTDITAAYGDKVKSAVRGLKFTNNRTAFVLKDEIELSEPSDVYWGMHTPAKVTLSEDKKTALLDIRGNKLEAKIMSEQGEFSCDAAWPLPECYHLEGETPHPDVTKLAMRFKDAEKVDVAICFTPLGYANNVDIKYPEIENIADWKLDNPGEAPTTIVPDLSDVVLKDLKINGKTIDKFSSDATVFKYSVDSRVGDMPYVVAESDYETEIIYPEKWPGNIKIRLYSQGCTIEREIIVNAPPATELDYSHNEIRAVDSYVDNLTQFDNPPQSALDHDLDTRMALETPNFVVFDFGESKNVDKLIMAFYNGHGRKTFFDVDISDDNENWTNVFSGESCGTTAGYETFDIGNNKARYIKIKGKGTSTNENWLSITEFRAFGAK